ncbi:MAG: T9SS type A sorting domain-containing protein [Bacteroidales bacterium]|nr:T9SS type A sorting domain-containing protein [Bacteroidales bacterium]
MKKFLFSAIALLSLSVVLISWGGVGHSKISESVSLSFNPQMQDFESWVVFLRDHASDADYRKSTDYTESPKHYIDIDKYNDFITNGRIPQTLDSVNTIYGSAFVIVNGILPWATKASFDSLRNCMQRHDFVKAQVFAADLGHYVADGHMPLHITKNYDGQYTGNDGIHSRYESTMIGTYISQIIYAGETITEISNVNQYIFDYLYANYSHIDAILLADTYAKTLGTTYSDAYKTALWTKTKDFTIPLFRSASHAFAELIYTAWIEAGSPALIDATATNPLQLNNAVLEQNTPNPFASSSHINFTLKENTKVLMQVYDINGSVIATLVNDNLPEGSHACEWAPENVPSGLYYLVLNTGKSVQVKKMVYKGGV